MSTSLMHLILVVLAMVSLVASHGVDVRFCKLSNGYLRILVENWHSENQNISPSSSDTMTISQDVSGSVTSITKVCVCVCVDSSHLT